MAKIVYDYSDGTIRSQPLDDDLTAALLFAADAAGVDQIRVFSGGQPATGRMNINRKGSHRHDDGRAADLRLVVDGQVIDHTTSAGQAVASKFVENAVAAGAHGVGAGLGYMGPNSIHVGYGSSAAWGADGKSANAPSWIKAAHVSGKQNVTNLQKTLAGSGLYKGPIDGIAGPMMRAALRQYAGGGYSVDDSSASQLHGLKAGVDLASLYPRPERTQGLHGELGFLPAGTPPPQIGARPQPAQAAISSLLAGDNIQAGRDYVSRETAPIDNTSGRIPIPSSRPLFSRDEYFPTPRPNPRMVPPASGPMVGEGPGRLPPMRPVVPQAPYNPLASIAVPPDNLTGFADYAPRAGNPPLPGASPRISGDVALPSANPRRSFPSMVAGRPDVPVGAFPAAPPSLASIVAGRPDVPIGAFPEASPPPFESMVAGRPDVPMGAFPGAAPTPVPQNRWATEYGPAGDDIARANFEMRQRQAARAADAERRRVEAETAAEAELLRGASTPWLEAGTGGALAAERTTMPSVAERLRPTHLETMIAGRPDVPIGRLPGTPPTSTVAKPEFFDERFAPSPPTQTASPSFFDRLFGSVLPEDNFLRDIGVYGSPTPAVATPSPYAGPTGAGLGAPMSPGIRSLDDWTQQADQNRTAIDAMKPGAGTVSKPSRFDALFDEGPILSPSLLDDNYRIQHLFNYAPPEAGVSGPESRYGQPGQLGAASPEPLPPPTTVTPHVAPSGATDAAVSFPGMVISPNWQSSANNIPSVNIPSVQNNGVVSAPIDLTQPYQPPPSVVARQPPTVGQTPATQRSRAGSALRAAGLGGAVGGPVGALLGAAGGFLFGGNRRQGNGGFGSAPSFTQTSSGKAPVTGSGGSRSIQDWSRGHTSWGAPVEQYVNSDGVTITTMYDSNGHGTVGYSR